MDIMLLKSPAGALIPMGEEEAERLKAIKSWAVVRCKISTMRNGPFFRKWFGLVTMAFNLASERMQPMEHRGRQVLPNFDRFRKDVTVLAGYFDPVYGFDGTLRLEARSLRWDQMEEDEFTRLYSDTINVILQKVLPGLDRDQLEHAVRMTLTYA